MRISPSIIPGSETYLVLDNYRTGPAWAETDEERTDLETLLRDLMAGQYTDPVRVVSFNTTEGWSRDASGEIVEELQRRCAARGEVPPFLEQFLERYGGGIDMQLSLL